jgi:predicted molibdopterin-dependent oxidoreductase YjgC
MGHPRRGLNLVAGWRYGISARAHPISDPTHIAEAVTVTLTINGATVLAETGETVLDTANRNGIPVPSLCHQKDLVPVGSCRLCMVEIEGFRTEAAACALKVAEGMVVHTETPRIAQTRKLVLEMLLSRYHDADALPAQETEFMYWVRHYGARGPAEAGRKPAYRVDSDPHPAIRVDLNKCILCTRCVRACAELQGRFVWGVAGRGEESHLVAGANATMLGARCESCGACAAFCPTGALSDRNGAGAGSPDKLVTTTCSYCGVGCNFDLNVKDGRIVGVTTAADAPVNGNALCVKGRFHTDMIHSPARLTTPLIRKNGVLEEASWEDALALVARRFAEVRDTAGPDAFAALSSARCTNEENWLMQKFVRAVMRTNNIDHCART